MAVILSVPSTLIKQPPIQSMAGAVPVRNEKSEISMEKVKVKWYVSGKRPDNAPMKSSNEDCEEIQLIKKAKEQEAEPEEQEEDSSSDPQLRRLQNRISEDVEERLARHGKIAEPEVVGESDSEVKEDAWRMEPEDSSEDEEKEIDNEEMKDALGRSLSQNLDALNIDDENGGGGRNTRHGKSMSSKESRGSEKTEKPLQRRKQKLNI